MLPDLFKRLKPLYGKKIDALWLEYQLGDVERKKEIEMLLTLLAAKRLGIAIGDERIVLEPPPPALIGAGEYTIGAVSYPGLEPYPFCIGRNELLRHCFILGPTGTGKSTLILGLLQQLLVDGCPFMVFDFKRNYRCLLGAPGAERLVVVTVGRDIAPLHLNALCPPPGVEFAEWAAGLADIISTSYLLMQGARNVLVEALLRAHRDQGDAATLSDAYRHLDAELRETRPGSRRYGWLESSTRSLEELSKGPFGRSLNAADPMRWPDLLGVPVVFELQGLGEDQKRFLCLYVLHAVLQLRKNLSVQREVLRHSLVFDEAHNVFPREQYGELGVASRLAREVREYGEAIIAATQQTDVAESLIANSGIKIILRTDYPKDVDFASKLLQVEPRWLAKLSLGTGIARLPTRYYQPFLFTFPPQPRKNTVVADAALAAQYDVVVGRRRDCAGNGSAVTVSNKEQSLLLDIAEHPIAGLTARYARLGWNAKSGNEVKDGIIGKGLAAFEEVPTATGRVKILTPTVEGRKLLTDGGVAVPTWCRGGAAHEYWRATIRGILEGYGYTVTDECHVQDGSVDLYAQRGDHEAFIEIETGKSDIQANIQKCQRLSGIVVFFFITDEIRRTWDATIEASPNLFGASPNRMAAIEQLR